MCFLELDLRISLPMRSRHDGRKKWQIGGARMGLISAQHFFHCNEGLGNFSNGHVHCRAVLVHAWNSQFAILAAMGRDRRTLRRCCTHQYIAGSAHHSDWSVCSLEKPKPCTPSRNCGSIDLYRGGIALAGSKLCCVRQGHAAVQFPARISNWEQ